MGEGEYTTRGTSVATVAGRAVGIGADVRRVALIVSVTVGVVQVLIAAAGAPDDAHRISVATGQPTYLTYKDYGPLVAYGWDVIAPGVGSTVTFVEVLYIGRRW